MQFEKARSAGLTRAILWLSASSFTPSSGSRRNYYGTTLTVTSALAYLQQNRSNRPAETISNRRCKQHFRGAVAG